MCCAFVAGVLLAGCIPFRAAPDGSTETGLAAQRSAAEILQRSQSAGGGVHRPSDAMLVAVTAWRGRMLVEPPLFLARADFDAFLERAAQVDARALLPQLPDYRSGNHALEYARLEQMCLLSADGRTLRWGDDNQWVATDAKAGLSPESGVPAQAWKDAALAALNTVGGSGRAVACIPDETSAWSDAERRAVVAFIAAIPAAQRESPRK